MDRLSVQAIEFRQQGLSPVAVTREPMDTFTTISQRAMRHWRRRCNRLLFLHTLWRYKVRHCLCGRAGVVSEFGKILADCRGGFSAPQATQNWALLVVIGAAIASAF